MADKQLCILTEKVIMVILIYIFKLIIFIKTKRLNKYILFLISLNKTNKMIFNN